MENFVNVSVSLSKLIKRIGLGDGANFIFLITSLFYFLLWFLNPQNKIVVVLTIILLGINYLKFKDFRMSLLLTYLASMVIFTGKTYYIKLIEPGFYPLNFYPNGYLITFIISTKHILSALMLLVLFRDFIVSKLRLIKFNLVDCILIVFYVWMVVSDILISKKPEISSLYSLISGEFVILYFYLRAFGRKIPKLPKLILAIFLSIVIFESAISLQQFANSSPIYKSLEHQIDIVYFGFAPDELLFRFRPIGTFPHANILGVWLSFFLSIIFLRFYKKDSYFLLTSFAVGLVVLILTISRSAWLGFFASFMIILYVGEKVKKIEFPKIFSRHTISFLILAIFMFVFFVAPRAEKSFYSFIKGEGGGDLRLAQTQETLSLVLHHPLFGVGSNMSVLEGLNENPRGVFSKDPITVHNWYLLLAVEHGIPSLILFFIFMILSVKNLAAEALRGGMEENWALGYLGGVICLLIAGLFQNFFVLSLALMASGLTNQKDYRNQ